jgi:hypothetical protein
MVTTAVHRRQRHVGLSGTRGWLKDKVIVASTGTEGADLPACDLRSLETDLFVAC